MLTIQNYVKAESLEQAYELNQKKNNRIVGGMLWMKMQKSNVGTIIDLSGLGLNTIEENDEEFSIGCMATLRMLEEHEGLNALTQGAFRESVCHIVGVQFRNLATVGGSIFGRFGFSDVLTMFMALDSYVELYKGGIVPMADFAKMPLDNDILVRVIVKKKPMKCCYMTHRNSKTDFPVIACAIAVYEEGMRVSVGARPHKALMVEVGEKPTKENAATLACELAKEFPTGSNMRASGEYRKHLVEVLLRRMMLGLAEV